MNYEIKQGTRAGAIEILFDCKPDAATRNTLKANAFRWNAKKSVWYGFCDPETISALLSGAAPDVMQPKTKKPDGIDFNKLSKYTGVVSDGYMGANRWDGVNSKKSLYGSELSKAIRAALKDCNISGITVSCKTYSGGQSITLTFAEADGDLIPFSDFKARYMLDSNKYNYGLAYQLVNCGWMADCVHVENFYTLPDDRKLEVFQDTLKARYADLCGDNINHYHIEKNEIYTDQFINRINAALKVVNSFNYDDSNSMVDYFSTNFYLSCKLKRAA